MKQKLEIEKAAEGLARAATGCKVGPALSPWWLLAAGWRVEGSISLGGSVPMLYLRLCRLLACDGGISQTVSSFCSLCWTGGGGPAPLGSRHPGCPPGGGP